METDNSSSVRALGLGLMFVGGTIVMSSGVPFLMSLFLPEDFFWQMNGPGMNAEDNPFSRLIRATWLWAGNILFGLLYIYVASQFRELERWSYRAIIAMSAFLPVIVLIAMIVVLSGLSGVAIMAAPSVIALTVYAVALIWYLSKKQVKMHFTP